MGTISDAMAQNLPEKDSDKQNDGEEFYNPLSVTGYLTPLQRKKLREKRNCHSTISIESEDSMKVIKPRLKNREKELNKSVSKKKALLKKKKPKHHVSPSIQYSVSRIVSKSSDDLKKRKFFKTSSPNRLERANYCMPFVFKKNLFSKLEKNIKEYVFQSEKNSISEEHSSNSFLATENEDSVKVGSPCIIKIEKSFSNVTESSLHRELPEIKMTKIFASENSFFDFDWPSDELLMKRQEMARANNVKKCDILKEQCPKDDSHEEQSVDESVKFYPIFYISKQKQSKGQQDNKRIQKSSLKKMKEPSGGGEQMIIDAGQKEIGAKVCETCNMIYSLGMKEDEEIHLKYHDAYLLNLKFPGWKEENVIGEYGDGRIIMVRRNEQSFKIKKIQDVLEIAQRDLGFPTSTLPPKPDLTFLLFISIAKQVVGCIVAEPISCASRVLLADNDSSSMPPEKTVWKIGNWYSSSEMVPAVCGINRIWVAHDYRRFKVASRMIDCLRCHFIHGHVVDIRELAFTDPSPDGREFAASYTGTDNFLVYR